MNKKFTFFYILLLVALNSFSQWVTVPQTKFQDTLKVRYPGCFFIDDNLQLKMDTTCASILNEDSLSFFGGGPTSLIDLEGIQYFKNLKLFTIYGGEVTASPKLPEGLNKFSYYNSSYFGFIPPLNNDLRSLLVIDTKVNAFNGPLPDSLRFLYLKNNNFTSLPELPRFLDSLECSSQNVIALNTLPVLPDRLTYLKISEIGLANLPELPNSLKYLNCSQNRNFTGSASIYTLGNLPALPPNLETLICNENRLITLPELPNSLKYLVCSNQRWFKGELESSNDTTLVYAGIDHLPILPPFLETLVCDGNALTELPTVLPSSLSLLSINNNIKRFRNAAVTQGITCLPYLPTSLNYINTQNTLINCFPNSGAFTNGAMPPRPICNSINNSNQCSSLPVISGYFFYDFNRNGLKDIAEPPRSNVKVDFTNGISAYSNHEGYFEISGLLGSNTININPPPAYQSIPPFENFFFTNSDTIVARYFALQTAGNLDSLLVSIIATGPARPGFGLTYKVLYENIGTTAINGALNFNFPNNKLSYISASIPGVSESAGNLSFPPLVGIQPGSSQSIDLNFRVSSTGQIGDTIVCSFYANVNSRHFSDYLTLLTQGSFDPNDKIATPALSSLEISQNHFINYLIRFQNTGTDTAFRVVVTDTLDNLVDAESFQITTTSHPCKILRNSNKLIFEFKNINLPDSNVNELKSHGYINFRVKPRDNVSVGEIIQNNASIYFDYNTPIVTNIAVTSIIADPAVCFNLSETSTPASCAGISNGSITVTPNGGTAPFQYSLDSGTSQSSGFFTGVGAGIHTILVTDDNGCTSLINVNVASGSGVIATVTSTQPTCSEQGIIQITVSNGTAPFLYSINGGAMQSGSTFSDLSAGIYSVLVQDSNMCSYTESVTINSAPPTFTPTVTISSSANSVCAGEAVTITAAFSNGGTTPSFQWLVNGVNEGTNSATLIINPMVNVDVSVQLTSNDPCASPATTNSNTVSITVNPVQIAFITIAGNTILSAGTSSLINSTVINGGTSASYQWQDSTSAHSWSNISGAINSTIDFAPQHTGDGLRCVLTSTFSCPASTITTSNALYFIIDATLAPRVRLYPNPVRSILTIENNGQTPWVNGDIINENGRKVSTITSSLSGSEVRLDVSRLPAGVYFIRLTDKNGVLNYFKFIKQ